MRMPIEDFWERARPVQIESVATLVFSPEDLLLYLALQLTETGRLCGPCAHPVRHRGHVPALRETRSSGGSWSPGQPLPDGEAAVLCATLGAGVGRGGRAVRALRELRASFGQLPLEERFHCRGCAARAPGDDQPQGCACGVLTGWNALAGAPVGRATASRWPSGSWRGRASALAAARPWAWARRAGAPYRSTEAPRRAAAWTVACHGHRVADLSPPPGSEELAAVDRAFAILRHGDWYFIAPQSLDTSFYEQRYGKPIVRFPDACFASVRSYSRLLLTDEFYAAFAKYEYMLITQDDVYVLRDDLPHWLSRRFDYIGSPWPDGHEVGLNMSPRPGIHGHVLKAYVGNGGFSLRRIAACRHLLAEFREEVAWWRENGRAEDMFFAVFGQLSQQFVLPNLRVAAAFAWETSLPRMHALCQGQLPMAIHAYSKYDPEFFMDTILPAALSNGISAPADPSVARNKFRMPLPIKRKDHANLVAQLAHVDAQLAHLNDRINAVSDKRKDHAKLVAQVAHVEAQLAHLNERINAVSDYLLALPSPATSVPIVAKLPVDIGAAHEICLFVSFAPAPTLKSHVRDHIHSLVDQGIAVVLIVNTPHASEQLIIDADLVERLSGCLIRANSGFDFAAWAHAYSLLAIPQTCKRLYLVNDSLVGPLQPASYVSMIARIRGSTADLVGLTEHNEPQPHLQSPFLVVTQRLLRSEVFGRLMRGIVNMPTNEGVIFQYETQITRFLRAHGFRCEAVFPRLGQGDDDTIHNWVRLIEQGFPFVRTQILETRRDTSEAARLIPERGHWYLIAPQSLDTSFYERRYGKPIFTQCLFLTQCRIIAVSCSRTSFMRRLRTTNIC